MSVPAAPDTPAPPTSGNPTALMKGLNTGMDISSLMKQRLDVGKQEQQSIEDTAKLQNQQDVRKAQGEAQVADKTAAEAQGYNDALNKQLGDNPLPSFVPTQETATDLAGMFGLIQVLGVALGKAGGGQQSALRAMGAMTGMLDGWQQGKQEVYEKNRQDFEESLKDVQAKRQQLTDAFNRNIALLPLDSKKAEADMQIDLAKYGGPLLLQQAKTQGLQSVGKTIQDLETAQEKLLDIKIKLQTLGAKNLPTMSPDAIHLAAGMWLATGQMPQMGFGGAADRAAIITEGTNIAMAQGLKVEDILSGRVQYHADQQSLANMQKMADAAGSFEKTMVDNIEVIRKNLDQGVGSDWGTLVNRFIQGGRESIIGDPAVNQLQGAIVTVMDEYAKILSGNTTGGQRTTDAARAQVGSIMSEYNNAQTILGVINNVILPDAENRLNGFRTTIQGIRGRVGNLSPGGGGGAGKAQPTQADRDYVKAHPETRQDFIDHFGVEP